MMIATFTNQLGARRPAAAASWNFGRQLGLLDAETAFVWRCSG